jgi:hypothetical protein
MKINKAVKRPRPKYFVRDMGTDTTVYICCALTPTATTGGPGYLQTCIIINNDTGEIGFQQDRMTTETTSATPSDRKTFNLAYKQLLGLV